MADNDIKFRVSQTGAEKVADDFNKVDDSIGNMQDSGNRTSPIIKELGRNFNTSGLEAKQYAGRIGGASLSMGKMTALVAGGTGLIAVLALAAVAFYEIAKPIYDAKKEMDDFAGSVETVIGRIIRVKSEFDKLKIEFDKESLTNAIATLEGIVKANDMATTAVSKIYTLGGAGGLDYWLRRADEFNIINLIGKENKEKTILDKTSLDYLKKRLQELKVEEMIMKSLADLGGKVVDTEKEKTKEIRKRLQLVRDLRGVDNKDAWLFGQLQKTHPKTDPSQFQFRTDLLGGYGFSREELMNMQQNAEEMKRQAEEHFNMIQDLSIISAYILREEFTQAWEDIFGEANSLFEKFAQRISEYFIELALKRAAEGLLNLIFPGAGSAGQALPGYSVSGGGGDRSYQIVLDGEVLGSFVDRQVPYSVNRAVRLNVL